MLLELLRPISLLLSIFSLYRVFYAAFLRPDVVMEQRIWDSLELLSIAAAVCVISGLIFREPIPLSNEKLEVEWREWRRRWGKLEGWEEPARRRDPLMATLPIQLFCWAAALMLALFFLSWYLETYYVLYRDPRRF